MCKRSSPTHRSRHPMRRDLWPGRPAQITAIDRTADIAPQHRNQSRFDGPDPFRPFAISQEQSLPTGEHLESRSDHVALKRGTRGERDVEPASIEAQALPE